MIKRITANKRSFKTVEFKPGFNVILADCTLESTQRDSRNGVGKTTLIEIIHFCLGAKTSKGKGLRVEALMDWTFMADLVVAGAPILITRSVKEPNSIYVEGDVSKWPIAPKKKKSGYAYGVNEWSFLLGNLYYGLPLETAAKYQPTFRSLISYNIRRSKDAFSTPFEYYRKQNEWNRQVCNAFLLGLAWNDASEMQLLKDRKKGLLGLQKAAAAGVLKGFVGKLGELEAKRIVLQKRIDVESTNIKAFKVHPQYASVRKQADLLTQEIHDIANKNSVDQRMLTVYERCLAEENAPIANAIGKIYAEAGVALPGVTLRRIDDVQAFHKTIIENRREFLAAELSRLENEIQRRDALIEEKSNQRSLALEILQTHGALEEYTVIQKRHLDFVSELNAVIATIENIKSCDSGLSQHKIDQEVLQQKARRDYGERHLVWEQAIALFSDYSDRLYNSPGRLEIQFGPSGFHYDVKIERSTSGGISKMKVFCYDMVLATIWANKSPSPKILIHDSTIFEGVDKRQRALAIETAVKESVAQGFQYICTLNSDEVPVDEFSKDFKLDSFVRVTLTDKGVEGSLLGVQF